MPRGKGQRETNAIRERKSLALQSAGVKKYETKTAPLRALLRREQRARRLRSEAPEDDGSRGSRASRSRSCHSTNKEKSGNEKPVRKVRIVRPLFCRDEKGQNRKASQSTKTGSLLATTTHDSEQAAEAAPGAMRFVQDNSLREIVEDAPSICERHSQRNDVSDRIRDYRGCTSTGSFGHCWRDLSAVPVPRFQFARFPPTPAGGPRVWRGGRCHPPPNTKLGHDSCQDGRKRVPVRFFSYGLPF